MAESQGSVRRTRGATRRQSSLEAVGGTAPPAVLGQLRHGHGGRRGFSRARRQQERNRLGQVGQVRRSPQAVAGRQSDGDAARGKPQTLLDGDNLGSWSPAPEAPQGKPGTGTRLAPTLHGGPGARHAAQDGHRDSPPPTAGVSSPAEDAAGGQAHSRGQDVTAGRSPHRPLRPDTVGPEDQQPPSRRFLG